MNSRSSARLLVVVALAAACGPRAAVPVAPPVREAPLPPPEAAAPKGPLAWETFDSEIFARSAAAKKFVLLDNSAEWCHWCHVMEAVTYHDPAIRRRLDAHFLAAKVDIDERPDLEERYRNFGWPATVIFSPEGQELGVFQGYLTPEELAAVLDEATGAAQPAGESLLGRTTDNAPPWVASGPWTAARFAEDRARIDAVLEKMWDSKAYGWGDFQKAPLGWADLWLLEKARRGAPGARERAAQVLDAEGQIHDPVFGGIYQYSVGNTWKEPHFEKLGALQAFSLWADAEAALVLREPAPTVTDSRASSSFVGTGLTACVTDSHASSSVLGAGAACVTDSRASSSFVGTGPTVCMTDSHARSSVLGAGSACVTDSRASSSVSETGTATPASVPAVSSAPATDSRAKGPVRSQPGPQEQGPVRSQPPANSQGAAARETAGPQGQGPCVPDRRASAASARAQARADRTFRYIERFLRAPEGGFYTSQDADVGAHAADGDAKRGFLDGHAYYALPESGRLAYGIPRIDRGEYGKENGLFVLAYLAYAQTGHAEALGEATRGMDRFLATHRQTETPFRGFSHAPLASEAHPAVGDRFTPRVRQLADQVYVGLALVALAASPSIDAPTRRRYLQEAQTLVGALERGFAAPDGGFYATTEDAGARGIFARRRKPFDENAIAALFLFNYTRLSVTGGDQLLQRALQTTGTVATPAAIATRGRMLAPVLFATDAASACAK